MSHPSYAFSWCLGLFLGVFASCHQPHGPPCDGGTCWCPAGDDCTLPCAAPPCHLDCLEDSSCAGECANGDCTCRAGASCSFACDAPPCHVICDGDNPHCDGACANGSCTCGADSSCAFVCDAPPCHASCAAGSACTLECPSGYGDGCDFSECAGTEPTICPDGVTAVCGAACPSA